MIHDPESWWIHDPFLVSERSKRVERGWLVRRAGLARVGTGAFAVGIGLAALAPWGINVALCTQGAALLAAVSLLVLRIAANSGTCSERSLSQIAGILLPWFLVGLLLASGLLLGALRVDRLTESDLRGRAGEPFEGKVTILERPRMDGRGQSAAVEVISADVGGDVLAGAGGEKILLEIPVREESRTVRPADGLLEMSEGWVLALKGRLELPESSPSGFDRRAYLRRRGIMALVQAESAAVRPIGTRGGLRGALDGLRTAARSHLGEGVSSRHGGLLRGVVLGDKSGVPDEVMESFRLSGTAHMLAVSGLHVGSLAAIGLGARHLLGAGPRGGAVLAGALVLVFVPLTGAGPSVVRAATMILVMLLGQTIGRSRERWQVLLLAAVVVLGRNPLDVFSPAFQLSFAAVTGLYALVPPIERRLVRLPDTLRSGLAVSAAATAGTAPVAFLVFDRAAWIGVLANLFVVPVLPFVMGLGLVSLAGGYIWSGISRACNVLAGLLLEWAVRISGVFAHAPPIEPDNAWRVAAGATGAFVGLVAGVLAGRRGLIRRRDRRSLAAAMVLGAAAGAVLYPVGEAAADAVILRVVKGGWPEQGEFRVLDVGQGNATLVRGPSGRAVLVDAGPDGTGLDTELRRLGVRSLDLVVISHPHADHYAGLRELVGRISVGVLLDNVAEMDEMPALEGEVEAYVRLRRELEAEGTRHALVESGSRVDMDGVGLVLRSLPGPVVPATGSSPSDGPTGSPRGPPQGVSLNETSVVVTVRMGGVGVLLPGDAEARTLARYPLEPVTVVVVPHHGSADALDEELLDRLEPAAAVISVGAENSFGHPNGETLELLGDAEIPVFRTDRSGWIGFMESEEDGPRSAPILRRERVPPG